MNFSDGVFIFKYTNFSRLIYDTNAIIYLITYAHIVYPLIFFTNILFRESVYNIRATY